MMRMGRRAASGAAPRAARPAPDALLAGIADYVHGFDGASDEARATAHLALKDALACAFEALDHPACTRLLGPVVPGTIVPRGARVPGTRFTLDPVRAAWNLGAMIRWLDYNDTWLAAEWGHPSDNVGGILAVADWLSRIAVSEGRPPLRVHDVQDAMIRAYEIQGVLALGNAFNRVGLDHVLLVEVATTAVVARMLGLSRDGIVDAVSHAWVDGHPLRTYRHAPNTVSRKSWAAADATARGVQLALMARAGEKGCPAALSAPAYGFCDARFRGQPVRLERPFGSYVMENVLFKVRFPAEFHAQTAAEAALALHPQVAHRLADVEAVEIRTHEAALRIIDKPGPLANPADRDHCLQYVVAVALIFGRLVAADYEDAVAADPRIDALRARMRVTEDPSFSRDYLDPAKRSIANAVRVRFRDGSATPGMEVAYPVGHRRRRDEARPLLDAKFRASLARFAPERQRAILEATGDAGRLAPMPVHEFVDLMVP